MWIGRECQFRKHLNPKAKIAEGYGPNMPTYKGRLSDKKITALIAYLKSLKD